MRCQKNKRKASESGKSETSGSGRRWGPGKTARRPPLSAISLFVVSVALGKRWSESIKRKIPETIVKFSAVRLPGTAFTSHGAAPSCPGRDSSLCPVSPGWTRVVAQWPPQHHSAASKELFLYSVASPRCRGRDAEAGTRGREGPVSSETCREAAGPGGKTRRPLG